MRGADERVGPSLGAVIVPHPVRPPEQAKAIAGKRLPHALSRSEG